MRLERLVNSSDWISPMIIKELRQGLHSRLFITFYLVLQGLLVISVFLMASTYTTDSGTWLFWFTVSVTLMLALPARGLVAISLEVRAKTMELIYLTRLSSLRIILGKWGALFLQGLLCVIAVLPYLLVRYLMGGQEIIYEFAMLFIILLFSALCMAMTVSFSALTNWWGRGALAAVAFTTVYYTITFAQESINVATWLPGVLYLMVCGGLLTAISLYFGASLIATATDSHTLVLRCLCLVFCLVVPPVGAVTGNILSALVITMAVLLLVTLSSLISREYPISGNLRPFAKLGPLGRPAAMLFSPGWASGLVFTLFLFALIALGLTLAAQLTDHLNLFEGIFYTVSLLGSILVPLALVMMFQKEDEPRLLPFIWVQVSMLFAAFFFQLVEQVLEAGTGLVGPFDLLALMPTATLALFAYPDVLAPAEYTRFLTVNCIITACAALFLLWKARPHLRELEEMRQHFRAALKTVPASAT